MMNPIRRKGNGLQRPFHYRYDSVIFYIIGANILVFLAQQAFGWQGASWIVNHFAMIPIAVVQLHWFWTFITYMFVHDGFSHIFFNMFALFVFGAQVERQMGSKEFLLFYFLTGALAGLFSFIVYYFTGAHVVALMGASGAIFAVQLAYAILFPNSIIYLWGILPLRAPVMVLGFTALELFSSVAGFNNKVAHFTHLAGFGFAWLYFLIHFGINPIHAWKRK
ncbi:glpG protein [Spirochaetia bacterium]|nr:glpG protein [Spirochaetia bacterium]